MIPKWNNDEAVAAWVGKIIADAKDDADFADAQDEAERGSYGIPASFIFEGMERDAIEAARRGNFKLLADLIRPQPKNPFIKFLNRRPGPEAMELIALRLLGEHKVKRGRSKQSSEQRRINTPVHDAADEVDAIASILRTYYPKEQGIRERAITIAATRAGIKRTTVANYLRSRRRLP